MTVFLLRLLVLILILWLLRRFVAALIGPSKRPRSVEDSRSSPTTMVKDPVCGMYMDSRLAVRLDNRQGTFYFCSETCKSKFTDSSGEKSSGSALI